MHCSRLMSNNIYLLTYLLTYLARRREGWCRCLASGCSSSVSWRSLCTSCWGCCSSQFSVSTGNSTALLANCVKLACRTTTSDQLKSSTSFSATSSTFDWWRQSTTSCAPTTASNTPQYVVDNDNVTLLTVTERDAVFCETKEKGKRIWSGRLCHAHRQESRRK